MPQPAARTPCARLGPRPPSEEGDTLPPTLPAPPPLGGGTAAPRLPNLAVRPPPHLYAEAIAAARELATPSSRGTLESLPPSSAPLRVAPSFTVAVLEMERDARRAELALRSVLSREPDLAEAHYHLAVLRLRRGDVITARRHLNHAKDALSRRPGPPPRWAGSLGALLSELG
ncbi:MAG TPA: hypothetical protein VHE30_16520 [Polyangiaceae bacterium]|nr:hypothetical protein [Polyangiaceae bacterium]